VFTAGIGEATGVGLTVGDEVEDDEFMTGRELGDIILKFW
jgi:hypothetical protein